MTEKKVKKRKLSGNQRYFIFHVWVYSSPLRPRYACGYSTLQMKMEKARKRSDITLDRKAVIALSEEGERKKRFNK